MCPRCGADAGEEVFCASCGLNLKQQPDLPTADAYVAAEREKKWLEQAQAEAQHRHKQQRTATEDRRRELRAQRGERLAEVRRRGGLAMRLAIPALAAILVLVAAALAAWHFTKWNAPGLGRDPFVSTAQVAASSSTVSPNQETRSTTSNTGHERSCGTTDVGGTTLEIIVLREVECGEAMSVASKWGEGGQPTTPAPWECSSGRVGDPDLLGCGAGGGPGLLRHQDAPRAFIGRLPTSGEASGETDCGVLSATGPAGGGQVQVHLTATNMDCSQARAIGLPAFGGQTPAAGWSCSGGADVFSCTQGDKSFSFGPA